MPGLQWTWRRTCEQALALISSHRLAVAELITDQLSVEHIADGYERLRSDPDHTLKVVLSWK